MSVKRSTPRSLSLAGLPRLHVDGSSWLSWACYVIGFSTTLALVPRMAPDLIAGGTGRMLLLGAVALFFVSVILVQRFMQLSLKASSFGTPSRLMTGGCFRYTRNPIYTAFLLPLASFGYYSPLGALISISLYMASMTYLVILREEAHLAEAFGAEYARYRAATPRWLFIRG